MRVPGRYYFVPDDTPMLPVDHYLGSARWYSEEFIGGGPGEPYHARRRRDPGNLPVPIPPAILVGGPSCVGLSGLTTQPAILPTVAGIDIRCWILAGVDVPPWEVIVLIPADVVPVGTGVVDEYRPSRISDPPSGPATVNAPWCAVYLCVEPLSTPPSAMAGHTLIWADAAGALHWTLGTGTTAPFGNLNSAYNLADLADVAVARSSLGLGSAAQANVEDFDAIGAASAAVAAHAALADPHPGYLTPAEGSAAYDAIGAASAAVAAHAALADPHPGYLTPAEGDAAYQAIGTTVPLTRTITTTAPMTGGGALSSNLTLATPVFVAAGSSHATGLVPDPGATSHPGVPYVLGEAAVWVLPVGKALGKSYTTNNETTTSGTPTGLTTAQTVTFTLDSSGVVWIELSAIYYNSTAGGNNVLTIDLDGTDHSFTLNAVTSNAGYWGAARIAVTLAAGVHVATAQFSRNTGTAGFFNRLLTANVGEA